MVISFVCSSAPWRTDYVWAINNTQYWVCFSNTYTPGNNEGCQGVTATIKARICGGHSVIYWYRSINHFPISQGTRRLVRKLKRERTEIVISIQHESSLLHSDGRSRQCSPDGVLARQVGQLLTWNLHLINGLYTFLRLISFWFRCYNRTSLEGPSYTILNCSSRWWSVLTNKKNWIISYGSEQTVNCSFYFSAII